MAVDRRLAHLHTLLVLLATLVLAGCPVGGKDASGNSASQAHSGECVVLLHGLGRTSGSMEELAEALQQAGYATANIDYPSRSASIVELAGRVVPEGIRQCRTRGARYIHFVTHSMGGILLRFYLAKHRLPELGRVVMLAPPNGGSEVADALRDNALYQWLNGPAGQELGREGLVARLGPADYPVGIITGNQAAPWDLWFSKLIPGEDDGKVGVESARLEGMRDFLVVPYSHTFIMSRDEVIGQVLHFLETGRFRRDGKPTAPQRPGA